jgi:hypothetical protein
MQKAVAFSEVRIGDVVCKERGIFLKVQAIGSRDGLVVLTGPLYIGRTLMGEGLKGEISGKSAEVICIVYQPWPAGSTKREMLDVVAVGAELVARVLNTSSRQYIHNHLFDPDEAIELLRKAVEEYTLGQE